MKKIFLAIILFPCIELFSVQKDSLKESVSDIVYCAEIDLCSKYIFRGIVLNENFVIQPVLSASYKNFRAGVWSNISTLSTAGKLIVSEYDIYISHIVVPAH